ncbi:Transcription elongation factor spt6, partial [Tieghemiomyces parasiticus]
RSRGRRDSYGTSADQRYDYDDEDRYARRPGHRRDMRDDLDDFIADEDEDDDSHGHNTGRGRRDHHALQDEDDELPEGGDEANLDEDGYERESGRSGTRSRHAMAHVVPGIAGLGLDADSWHNIYEVFGDGTEYDFALEVAPPGRRPAGGDYDDYDDEDEDGLRGPGGRPADVQLKDLFEPAELERKLMTDADNEIRARDIPERMQLRLRTLPALAVRGASAAEDESEPTMIRRLTGDEVEAATEWALQHFLRPTVTEGRAFEEYTAAVLNVIRFVGQDFLEVPFILANRRDYLVYSKEVAATLPRRSRDTDYDYGRDQPPADGSRDDVEGNDDSRLILSAHDLWTLFEVDTKFRAFTQRKREVAELVRRLRNVEAEEPAGSPYSLAYIRASLDQIRTVEEVHDLVEYLHLLYGAKFLAVRRATTAAAQAGDTDDLKRPPKHALYDRCRKSPVAAFAARAALASQKFAVNYVEQTQTHFVDTPSEGLDALADQFVNGEFHTPAKVVRAAQAMLAQEISYDPLIRSQIRAACRYYATVTVTPTAKGEHLVDNLHPYYPFKFLRAKPVTAFLGSGQFLDILKGESDGLLRVRIELSQEQGVLDTMAQHYVGGYFSEIAAQWDGFRREVLALAFREYLLPLADRYTRDWLRSESEECVGQAVQQALETKLNVQACRPPALAQTENPRVLTVTPAEGQNARSQGVAWAALDSRGQLVDQGVLMDLRDPDNAREFVDLLGKRRPDVVGVAGTTTASKRLLEDVQLAVEDYQRSANLNAESMTVTWVDDETARMYRDSPAGREQFPQLTSPLRYCVALGRALQDPLAAYAALGPAVRVIAHHPSQTLLGEDVLGRYVERAFVNVVNRVGVDVNRAVQFPHLAATLPYVAGLGPRKVASVLKRLEVVAGGRLDSRAALIINQVVTRVIFMNCASFLRVVPCTYDVLDDTRIHPEDYALARKMATDALEVEVEDEADDDDNPSLHVEELMHSDPAKLNELLLEDYAQELEKQLQQPKLEVLRGIKRELQHPYADPRRPYRPPTAERVFTMLTGETDDSLWVDQVVVATVQRVRERFAICKLDSDLDGFLPVSRIMEDRVEQVSDVLSEGEALPCVVTQINREKFSVDLSARPSDLEYARAQNGKRHPPLDPYFDYDADQVLTARHRREAQREAASASLGTRATRVINHPLFKSLRSREAEEYLADRPIGDVVIRASSRGRDHLAITWKVADGVYQHVDVVEEGGQGPDSDRTLRVGEDATYSDLDELLASHIEPMAKRVEAMMAHPKFTAQTQDEVGVTLRSACNAKQSGDYAFVLAPDRPGWFLLAFMANPRAAVQTWKVQVCPNAYKLGNAAYASVGELINGFKRMQMNKARSSASGSSRPHPSSSGGRQSRFDRGPTGMSGGSGGGTSSHRSSSTATSGSSWDRRPVPSSSSAQPDFGW